MSRAARAQAKIAPRDDLMWERRGIIFERLQQFEEARSSPGKVVLDRAVALALGGDCLAGVAVLRAEPGVFGPVASDPTVSRTIDALAADMSRAMAAINTARAAARAQAWRLAGEHGAPARPRFQIAASLSCPDQATHTPGSGNRRTRDDIGASRHTNVQNPSPTTTNSVDTHSARIP